MKPELVRQHFEKGDYISSKELEKAYGKPIEGLDLLKVCSEFDLTHERHGIVVRIQNGGVKFCTDKEATEYCDQRIWTGMNQMRRYAQKQGMVDTSRFSPPEKERHERNHHRNTLMVLGAQEGIKRAAIELKASSSKKIEK